jgi:2-C-methyl-D-erythritol 4-phosphate cytidylyltransferase
MLNLTAMQQYVLIVAGGKGERMKAPVPKQYIEISGKPLLMHTMEAFANESNKHEFIVVLPFDSIATWVNLCKIHHFQIEHKIAEGGPKRFHSVKSGLKLVPENTLVAIHDANRPFVSKETIKRCFEMAARKGNAVPVIPFTESVREVSGVLNKVVDRSILRIVQTPQVFHSTQIKAAYRQNYSEEFTDDASVMEKAGFRMNLVEGNNENLKITDASDLLLAQQLLEKFKKPI